MGKNSLSMMGPPGGNNAACYGSHDFYGCSDLVLWLYMLKI
jgi:hypothetical protein